MEFSERTASNYREPAESPYKCLPLLEAVCTADAHTPCRGDNFFLLVWTGANSFVGEIYNLSDERHRVFGDPFGRRGIA